MLDGLLECDVEAPSEVGQHFLGKARRQREVHQVADLDRLCAAFVGHLTSRVANSRAPFCKPNICSDPTGEPYAASIIGPIRPTQIDLDHLVESLAPCHVVGEWPSYRSP